MSSTSSKLSRAWQRREGDTLTIAAYKSADGLTGSIASHAEEVYQRLSSGQRSAAQALLCAMAAVTEDQRVIRRSIDLHTLDLSGPDSDLSTALEAWRPRHTPP